MLIETFLKTLHKEKWLMYVNVIIVALSFVSAVVTVFWWNNLDAAIVNIVILLAFRCIFAEIWLASILKVSVVKDIILEILLTITFMCSSWFVGGMLGVGLYLGIYMLYIAFKRKEVWDLVNVVIFKMKNH